MSCKLSYIALWYLDMPSECLICDIADKCLKVQIHQMCYTFNELIEILNTFEILSYMPIQFCIICGISILLFMYPVRYTFK